MPFVKNLFSGLFPPKPAFTEKDIGNLSGKVSQAETS